MCRLRFATLEKCRFAAYHYAAPRVCKSNSFPSTTLPCRLMFPQRHAVNAALRVSGCQPLRHSLAVGFLACYQSVTLPSDSLHCPTCCLPPCTCDSPTPLGCGLAWCRSVSRLRWRYLTESAAVPLICGSQRPCDADSISTTHLSTAQSAARCFQSHPIRRLNCCYSAVLCAPWFVCLQTQGRWWWVASRAVARLLLLGFSP